MATYNYRAIDQTGRHAQGQIDALNEADLEIRLERMGLDLITFKSTAKSTKAFTQNKVSNRDLVILFSARAAYQRGRTNFGWLK